jgi:hypothetical protein
MFPTSLWTKAEAWFYAANFIANRIEVISMANLSLQSPIQLQPFPLDFTWLAFPSLALSPDGR